MISRNSVSRSMQLESIPSAIGVLFKQIISELEANNYTKEDKFAVRLALDEAFLNALKHGNKMDSDKMVKVDYSVSPEKVEISITDEGNGFDPKSVPDPRCGQNLFKTNGRGMFLMRAYMDLVEYNDRGNCVRMVRYKEKPSLSDKKD